ncbi:M15 family metallopeptidase [Moraxella porci]|uniref:M15 family metallopeptidase n=1 Tax=Moraxella porci TaxID=1288392 RepID=UPI0024499F33|nr:M15 family metallopeptidase [Moraxella porci]MDH2273007.1 M15 family metallopeptidase [Moraxella porci]
MKHYIKQIQTALHAAGHYTGKIDGIAGQMTLDAVNKALGNAPPKPTAPTAAAKTGGFVLSEKSIQKMDGVKDDLARVVKRAIEISDTDFTVIEGVRTRARQAELVKKGASKTMNSKHLTGHAVDIAPLIDGKISWDFEHYYALASAMAKAATELGVKVRWGGAWTTITGKSGTPQDWVKAYRDGGGKFLDGPHFELV